MPAQPTQRHITLHDAARLIYPAAYGRSGYDRLYQLVRRHAKSCPIKFSFLQSDRNGRPARALPVSSVPILKAWIESL